MSSYIGAHAGYAFEFPIDFDFHGMGILPPPTILVDMDKKIFGLNWTDEPGGHYLKIQFTLVNSQHEAALQHKVTQQTIGRWLKRGEELLKGRS